MAEDKKGPGEGGAPGAKEGKAAELVPIFNASRVGRVHTLRDGRHLLPEKTEYVTPEEAAKLLNYRDLRDARTIVNESAKMVDALKENARLRGELEALKKASKADDPEKVELLEKVKVLEKELEALKKKAGR